MEYIILPNQQNTYPSTDSYKKTALDTITLTGNFEINQLDFDIPNLDNIIIVTDTSFRFLLSIDDVLYTSPLYYNELITSYNESNPYFIQSTFNPNFVVKFSTSQISPIIANLKVTEKDKNINVKKNVFVLENGEYDYKSLVQYIDWLVSPVSVDDIETNGVLPAEKISEYELPPIPRPQSLITDIATTTVVTETIQALQYEYIRRRNLDREPLAVRDSRSTSAREIYRINEGDKFFARFLGSGTYEIFDDGRSARTGYVLTSVSGEFSRFKRIAGPFVVTILTTQTSTPSGQNNTPTQPTPTNPPSNNPRGSSPSTGGQTGGGDNNLGYGNGNTPMRPNVQYQR